VDPVTTIFICTCGDQWWISPYRTLRVERQWVDFEWVCMRHMIVVDEAGLAGDRYEI
jgi:hypothetical protein